MFDDRSDAGPVVKRQTRPSQKRESEGSTPSRPTTRIDPPVVEGQVVVCLFVLDDDNRPHPGMLNVIPQIDGWQRELNERTNAMVNCMLATGYIKDIDDGWNRVRAIAGEVVSPNAQKKA